MLPLPQVSPDARCCTHPLTSRCVLWHCICLQDWPRSVQLIPICARKDRILRHLDSFTSKSSQPMNMIQRCQCYRKVRLVSCRDSRSSHFLIDAAADVSLHQLSRSQSSRDFSTIILYPATSQLVSSFLPYIAQAAHHGCRTRQNP